MKRITICADGTWNRPEKDLSKDAPTNVLKLARAIAPVAPGNGNQGIEQVVFYDWGVGSYHDPVTGGAFGAGIDKNIQDAYRFIVQNYDPGDELFLFGFSRGAYTVRSLAGLIRNCGILRRPFAQHIHGAFELYRDRDDPPDSKEARSLRKHCAVANRTRIRFIGCWDTVGALGVPLSLLGFLNDAHLFHDTELSSIVQTARHALSIDETREDFAPTRWGRKAGIDMQQVWFAGGHSDVGGGFLKAPGDAGLLSDIPLNWMIREAELCGLGVEAHVKHDLAAAPFHLAAAHAATDKVIWKLLGRKPRTLRKSDHLHRSVQQRYSQQRSYRPAALTRFIARQGWQHVREWERVVE